MSSYTHGVMDGEIMQEWKNKKQKIQDFQLE